MGASISRQKPTLFELIGVVLCGLGLCFAVGFVGVFFSQEEIIKDKQQVLAQMDEMKKTLVAAKIPQEQIPGLLRIHKDALANEAGYEGFIVLSFLILLSLWVSSVGLIIMLWAKLRALARAQIQSIN